MQVILNEEEYKNLQQNNVQTMDLYDIASTLVKRFLREYTDNQFIITIGVNSYYDDVDELKHGDYKLKLIKVGE